MNYLNLHKLRLAAARYHTKEDLEAPSVSPLGGACHAGTMGNSPSCPDNSRTQCHLLFNLSAGKLTLTETSKIESYV